MTMKKWQFVFTTVFVLALALMAVGCSAGSTSNEDGKGAGVNVSMTDFAFQLDKNAVPAGPITFHVKNTSGAADHEMVVIKTDLDAKQLPTQADKSVDESQLDSKGEVEVEPGDTKDLSVTLEKGHYVLLCNEPGHYPQGMVTNFTVQ